MNLRFSEVGDERSGEAKSESVNASLSLHVLASGSKGNSSVVVNEISGRALAIDCGICKKDFFSRCEEVGVELASIEGILVTHEHGDHTKGLGVVTRGLAKKGLHPTVYVSRPVLQVSKELQSLEESCDIKLFVGDDNLSVSGLNVIPFKTSHDACESFGFRIEGSLSDSLGYMTDTGIVTPQAYDALSGCRILALESNHDLKMLETGPYPSMLKRRVASERGHLSNAQASEALSVLLNTKLEKVIAMHISENNNSYRMPREHFSLTLETNKHHAKAFVAYQQRVVSL